MRRGIIYSVGPKHFFDTFHTGKKKREKTFFLTIFSVNPPVPRKKKEILYLFLKRKREINGFFWFDFLFYVSFFFFFFFSFYLFIWLYSHSFFSFFHGEKKPLSFFLLLLLSPPPPPPFLLLFSPPPSSSSFSSEEPPGGHTDYLSCLFRPRRRGGLPEREREERGQSCQVAPTHTSVLHIWYYPCGNVVT